MKKAWFISFVRFPLLVFIMLLIFLIYEILGLAYHFPFLPELSTVYYTIVNIISIIILTKLLKQEGTSISALLNDRFKKTDILYGFLWLFILYIPFVLSIFFVLFIIYGIDFIDHFTSVFLPESDILQYFRPNWLLWFSAVTSLIFPFLNAPLEELMYKSYAQNRLMKKGTFTAILIPSIGFALQHILLATTILGALVYFIAFLNWGIISGFIYYKQQRIFPLIIGHFIINLLFGLLPVLFMIFD